MKTIQGHLDASYASDNEAFRIMIGGDCSISPAIITSLTSVCDARKEKLGIIYFDGDADLTSPSQACAEGSSGILDSMVMGTLTQRSGCLESIEYFSRSDESPSVNRESIVLFGSDSPQPATEHWTYLLENGFKAYTRPIVQADPIACAMETLAWLDKGVDKIFLHFDVDVIDSGRFPLADYPHYAGLNVKQAMDVLKVFLGDERVMGYVVTEINVNNDLDGEMVRSLVEGIVEGFRAGRDRVNE